MPDISHIVSDAELDVPIRSVTATNEHPSPWNSPEVIRQALELPVWRVCWLLREMGIATTASTANAKNIGNEAGMAIDLATLTEANRAALEAYAVSHPTSVRISEGAAELLVPIADGEVTARAISDQFLTLIESSGLKQQPAKWAAPTSPEQLLRERVQDLYEMQFWRRPDKPEPVNVLDELMKALSIDPEHGLTMDAEVYEKYQRSADFLQENGIIEIEDGRPVLKGVHDPDKMAILLRRVFDPSDGRIWLAEETKEYYERTVQLTREAHQEAARASREQAPPEVKATIVEKISQGQQQHHASAEHVNPELPITLHQGVRDTFMGAVRGHISQLPPEVAQPQQEQLRRKTTSADEANRQVQPQAQLDQRKASVAGTSFTVDYGNHRTCAILVLMQQGQIDPNTVIGFSWNKATQTKEVLTAALLYQHFQDGLLLTSNSTRAKLPWITISKVEEILREFDANKLFNPERDGGHGIVIRAIPKEFIHSYSNYRDIRDNYGEGISLQNYLQSKAAAQVSPIQIPQQQQQQQRRPTPSAEEIALQQQGLEVARRRADTAIKNASSSISSVSSSLLPQGAVGLKQTPSMASRGGITSNIESPEFYDAQRIIPPDSELGREFSSFISGLAHKLLDPDILRNIPFARDLDYNSLEVGNVRYLLADEASINAYTIPKARPPIVVLHRGLIEQADSIDQISAILAHEWGHIIAAKCFPNRSNSKEEEAAADMLAVRLQAEIGQNPRALEQVLAKIEAQHSPEDFVSRLKRIFLDVHPLSENRSDTLHSQRILLERMGFALSKEDTPIPEDFRHAVTNARYFSETDVFARLRHQNFYTLGLIEKIELIGKVAEEITTNATPISKNFTDHYTDQFYEVISTLGGQDSSDRQKLEDAYSRMLLQLNKFGIQSTAYELALENLGYDSAAPYRPIGIFKSIFDSADRFIHATDDAVVTQAARDFQESVKEIGWYNLSEIEKPIVVLPSPADVVTAANNANIYAIPEHWSWHAEDFYRQISSDLFYDSTTDANVRLEVALNLFGVNGRFEIPIQDSAGHSYYSYQEYLQLFEYSDNVLASVLPEELQPIPALQEQKDQLRHLSVHGEGYKRLEASIIAQRDEWQQRILEAGVRWDLLLNDPEQFIRIYKEAIIPFGTVYAQDNHAFSYALMEYIETNASGESPAITPERRQQIFHLIDHASQAGFSTMVAGIPAEHPYARECLYLERLGLWEKEHSNIINEIRINPFNPGTLDPWLPWAKYHWQQEGMHNSISAGLAVREAAQILASTEPSDVQLLFKTMNLLNRLNELPERVSPSHYADAISLQKEVATKLKSQSDSIVINPANVAQELDVYANQSMLLRGHPEIFAHLEQKMVENILLLQDPQEKRYCLGKLISRYGTPRSSLLRREVAKIIAQDLADVIGKDTGSKDYTLTALSLLETWPNGNASYQQILTRSVVLADVLPIFADLVESQPELTEKLRNIAETDAVQRLSGRGAILEGAKESLAKMHEARAALLTYLMQPDSEKSRARVIERFESESAYALPRLFPDYDKSHNRDWLLSNLHQEFWLLSIQLRFLQINKLIFPAHVSTDTSKIITARLLDGLMGSGETELQAAHLVSESDYVDWKLKQQTAVSDGFDQRDAAIKEYREAHTRIIDSKESDSSKLARLIVDAYLDTVAVHDPKEAQLLVSALMSAEHERKPGESMRLGQTLHQVLSHMGPAGAKLLQAIHSHPDTPQDIKDDLKYSKIEHDKPLRWTAIDLARAAGLLDSSKTAHVGPVVAAGSFGITMFNTAPDGVTYADTLLRDRADAIAEREFNFMLKAAQIVANADDRMIPVLDMVRGARHSARIETQMSLAPKQNAIMEQVMDGVQVRVRGEDDVERVTTHNVMRLVDYGEGYKRAQVAQGEHFLTLRESVPFEERRAILLSMMVVKLTQRMAGVATDLDRHGGNIKVDGTELQIPSGYMDAGLNGIDINHFDLGMTELTLPSDVQKRALGSVIAQAVKDTNSGGQFIDHLLSRISKSEVSAEARSYLAGFNRDILAMGDYLNALTPPVPEGQLKAPPEPKIVKELMGILGHAMYNEHADPVIRSAYERELGPLARGKAEAAFRAAMAESSVTVSNVPRAADLRMPELSAEEYAIVHNQDHGLPHRLATQRMAVQSVAGNGLGVAMGAYGLWNKVADAESGFNQDIASGDAVRQVLAVKGAVTDVANIGAGAVSTAADIKTFQQAKAESAAPQTKIAAAAPSASPAGASSGATAATSQTGTTPAGGSNAPPNPPASTTNTATQAKAPTGASTPQPSAPPTAQGPAGSTATPAQGATGNAQAAQQAEKAAAEAIKDAAKAAQEASKASEQLLKAGRIASKAAIPLAVAAGTFDATAGAKAGDRERVAGAVGGTGGGILGGMVAGAAAAATAGALAGSAVPGIGTVVVGVVAGIGGAIAGAIAGEEAAKHWGSNLIGKFIGSDEKFIEAMKQLDAEAQKQFAKDGKKLTLDDVHAVLKGGKMDSVAQVDTDKNGKLSASELKAALEKARSTFLDNQLTDQISALEAKGWGKHLGNKDGKLTLDELKAGLKEKGADLASLMRDKKITGKAITDALSSSVQVAATPSIPLGAPPHTQDHRTASTRL